MNYLQKEVFTLIQQDENLVEWLLNQSYEGISLLDLENKQYEWVHPNLLKKLRLEDNESVFSLSSITESLCQTQWEIFLAKQLEDTKEIFDYDFCFEPHPATKIYLSAKVKIIYDVAKKPLRLLRVFGASNTSLSSSEVPQDFEEIFELSEELLSIANTEGYFIKVNTAWQKLLGFSKEQLNSEKFLDLVHPEDRPATQKAFELILQGEEKKQFTNRYQDAGGKHHWIEWRSVLKNGLIYSVSKNITQQVRIQSEVKVQQAMLDNISNNLAGMVLRYLVKPDGTDELIFVNKRVYDIYGITPEEALEDVNRIWSKVYPEDIPEFQKSINTSATQLSIWKYTWRVRLDDNTTKWLLGQGTPQKQEDGSILWDTLILDISPQKKLEQALEQQNYLLKGILESTQNAIFSVDAHYCYTSFNQVHQQAMKLLYGVDIEVGMNAPDCIVNQEDRIKAKARLDRTLKGESIIEEDAYTASNGTKHYYEVAHNPIYGEKGEIVGMAFIAIDTTERKKAENELIQTNQRLQLLENFINQSQDAIQVSDEQGRMVYLNQEALQRLNISPEEVQNHQVINFEPAFQNQIQWQQHIEELKSKEKIILESQNYSHKNKKYIPVEVTLAYRVIDEKGYVIAISRDISERKEAAKQIEIQKKYLETIVNYFPNGSISLIDDNLNILLTGGEGYKVHQIDPKQFVGKALQDILASEVYQETQKNIQKLKEGEATTFEVKLSDKYYLNTIQDFFDEENQIDAYILLSLDITERKKYEALILQTNQELRTSEEELKASEEELMSYIEELNNTKITLESQQEQLLLIFEAANLGAWDWDMSENQTVYNKQWLRLMEYQKEDKKTWELSDEDFFEVVHPEDRQKMIEITYQLLAGAREYFQEEYRIKTLKGNWKWVLNTGKVIQKSKQGRPLRGIGVYQDITPRKQSELALQKSQEESLRLARQYKGILDTQTVYVLKTDLEGNYTYINNYFYTVFGHQGFKIGDSSIESIIEEDKQKCIDAVEKCFQEPDTPHEVILRKLDQDGNIKGGKWEFKGVIDKIGQVYEILCVGFDITAQIESIEKIKKLLEISSEQNTKLKSFAYIVSHNVRSHAANFTGLLGLIQETKNESEKQLYFSMLESCAKQLDETIYNLNEIITINENLAKPKDKRNLKAEVLKTLDILAGEMLTHQVNITVDINEDTFVEVIPAYLESILLNLVSNAIKYRSLENPPIVEISAEKITNYVCLYVKDNGQGIDLERHKSKLFGMYKTFHNNPDARGFGLHITKTQIEAMGGKIEVESQVNVGSTFKVFFYDSN